MYNKWLNLLLLFTFFGNTQAQAQAEDAAYYTVALEWPPDSRYSLEVTSAKGVSITQVLQFNGNYRQTAIIVPALAACQSNTALPVKILAPLAKQAAHLIITQGQTLVYQQTITGEISAQLPALQRSACKTEDDGIIGELSIAVAKSANDTTLSLENLVQGNIGHAWIEFRALSPFAPTAFATVGTFNSIVGDEVTTGINFYREVHRPASVRKTVAIRGTQLSQLIEVINRYIADGTNAWTTWRNCTAFVVDAWQAATGESLSATQAYPNAPWEVTTMSFPNTVSLYHSVIAAGGQKLD